MLAMNPVRYVQRVFEEEWRDAERRASELRRDEAGLPRKSMALALAEFAAAWFRLLAALVGVDCREQGEAVRAAERLHDEIHHGPNVTTHHSDGTVTRPRDKT